MLQPESKMKEPLNEGRSGEIKRQRLSVNQISKRREMRVQPRYSKDAKSTPVQKKKDCSSSIVRVLISIREIDDMDLIKLWNRLPPLTSDTSPDKISTFF